MMELFDKKVQKRCLAIKIDMEQLAAEAENHRRNGLVSEAQQAASIAAQQHLEAVIAALEQIEQSRSYRDIESHDISPNWTPN